MATNSVGTLFVDLQARTAKLEGDMGKVRSILQSGGAGLDELGNKGKGAGEKLSTSMQRGVVGALLFRMALREIIKELAYVVENIENIPGIDGQVVASVQDLRAGLQEARNEFDKMLVSGLAFMSQWGQSIGASVAMVMNSHDGLPDVPVDNGAGQSADDRARAREKTPGAFDAQVAESVKKITAARERLREVTQTLGEKVNVLWEREKLLMSMQGSSHFNQVEKNALFLEQIQKETERERAIVEINTKLYNAQAKLQAARAAEGEKSQPLYTQIQKDRAQIASLEKQIQAIGVHSPNKFGLGSEDPVGKEKMTELLKQETEAQLKLNEALKKYGELYTELGAATAKDLTDGILKGEKMHVIFGQMISDVIRLIAQQEIEKPLAAMFTNGFSAVGGGIMSMIGGLATGGPYMANTPFIAGENGPELINPGGGSGTVTNAQQTAAGGGDAGSSSINVNNHFASGVTQQQLSQMMPFIVQQSKAAVIDAVRRGGAYRQVFTNGA